ncbi:S-layer homology domain-containing protein [Paenibacillus hamazuiensis]|uniref:S-layer homology domain-containing protein n=1 Tax=Paenibacillus hamazuiensis TaxID=2936508 RepID=UPI00200FC340|nr:S-layer homology domain-containing protein [Paenibacillus hamazuiensis]
MKKSISLIAAAAVALSMTANAVMAGPAKTAADYKDLTNLDAGLKDKVDTLLSQGIFEGVSDDSFGITQNMTRAQFAKVAALIFGLKVDNTLQTSSFSDVKADDAANGWAIPYIEAAKAAGLIDGVTDTTFAPGEHVTVGQLDTVLVKGLGKAVNTSVQPWYADAVKQAADLGIHPVDKSGGDAASRADLVIGAYGAWQASHGPKNTGKVSVSSVQASGDHVVKVTLDQPVDTVKATLTLSKDGTVIPVDVAWSGDAKSAELTLKNDAALSIGYYTVTLGGLDSSAIRSATGSLTIGTTSNSGNIQYLTASSYVIGNVIDSGITGSATGANGYATREEAENPALSKLATEVVIKAKTSSGEEIVLPGLVQSATSTNPTIVKAAVSEDHKAYILGVKEGTATINIIYAAGDDKRKQVSIPVTVKNERVMVQTLEARDLSFNQYVTTVTGNVYAGAFNAFEKMDLKAVDNYGNEYEQDEIQSYNFALGLMFLPEDIIGDTGSEPVGTVTIDTDGTVRVVGNVTRFTLTATTPEGKRVSSDVYVYKKQKIDEEE